MSSVIHASLLFCALAALGTASCGPSAPTPIAVTPERPPRLITAADTEIVMEGVHSPMLIVGHELFATDIVDGEQRLFHASLDALDRREDLLRGRNFVLKPAGDAVLATALHAGEYRAFLFERGKSAISLGPAVTAAWDTRTQRVVIARPAAGDERTQLVTVSPSMHSKPLAIITDPSCHALEHLHTTPIGVWITCPDPGSSNVEPRTNLFLVADDGGLQRRFTVNNFIDMRFVDGKLLVHTLAHVYFSERGTGPLVLVPDVFWDSAAFDGDVAYYLVQTSRPPGQRDPNPIGGWLYTWRAPKPPIKIIDDLDFPQAIAVSAKHVYFIDAVQRVRRFPRSSGF